MRDGDNCRLTPAAAVQAPSEAQHSVAREEEERHMAVAPHERRSEAIQVLILRITCWLLRTAIASDYLTLSSTKEL